MEEEPKRRSSVSEAFQKKVASDELEDETNPMIREPMTKKVVLRLWESRYSKRVGVAVEGPEIYERKEGGRKKEGRKRGWVSAVDQLPSLFLLFLRFHEEV